jgi:hypothetical protein
MMFHVVCPLGKQEVATPIFLIKREKDGGAGKRRMFENLSLSSIQDISDFIDKIFSTNAHIDILSLAYALSSIRVKNLPRCCKKPNYTDMGEPVGKTSGRTFSARSTYIPDSCWSSL